MHRLRSFIELPATDRWLVLRAAGWLVAARLALWLLPFARVQDLAGRAGRARGPTAPAPAPGRLAWAVESTAVAIPRATCLTQALAAQIMLWRAGAHPELRFGVAMDASDFEAHAWLELDGRPLVGAIDLDRYVPLEGA